MNSLIVAKVGGSLYDLPDLRDRLRSWLANAGDCRVLLIPGGGAAANVVRQLDTTHRLGAESAHWLALRMLAVNAEFLSTLLDARVVDSPDEAAEHLVSILDAHAFCQADESRPGAMAHSWDVTSDSIAARVAAIANASLVLLKSAELPESASWFDAAQSGLVDANFAAITARYGIDVTWINLRRPGFAGPP